jgi:hypothetical protein
MKKKPTNPKTSPVKQPSVDAVAMSSQGDWAIVGIELTSVTIRRGSNYRLPLDFSNAPNGAGEFDSAFYTTTLTATNCPEAVIQEDANYKTPQRCAWIIYVPDDGYQSNVTVTLTGQMRGTGWTGGISVNGLWGAPELIG